MSARRCTREKSSGRAACVSGRLSAGYITMDKNNLILLTEEGRRRAEAIYDRHCTLTRFLEALGVSAENAAADACRIEHIISEETFDRIKDFLHNQQSQNSEAQR